MYVNIMFKFIKLNIHIQIVAAGVLLCVQQLCYLVYNSCVYYSDAGRRMMPCDYLCNFILCICFTLYCTFIVARINSIYLYIYPVAGVLGDFCQVKDDCLVTDSYCKSGICMCKAQYEAGNNNKACRGRRRSSLY